MYFKDIGWFLPVFLLMQYQETVLRVHFKDGHSFFSEEAKSPEFRHAAI